jgi:hypothetical protein
MGDFATKIPHNFHGGKTMKKRSITSRNLAGGFFGGLLGILFFKLIYPVLLPMGCLIGVVTGFLYQEIWQCICQSWRKSIEKATCKFEKSMQVVAEFRNLYADILASRRKIRDFFLRGALCVKTVLAFFIPLLFIFRWLKAHPMNRARSIQHFIAILLTAAFVYFALWGVKNTVIYQNFYLSHSEESQDALLLGWFFLWMILGSMPLSRLLAIYDSKSMRVFYREYDRYNRLGALRYTLGEIRRFIVSELILAAWIISGMGYFAIVGGLFLAIIVVPVLAAVYSLKGIYQITCKTRLWLCLGVTLSVTIASAWLTCSYLDDTAWLWVVALTTGTISGLASEGVRRLAASFFIHYEKLADYATNPIGEFLAPLVNRFWKFSHWLFDRMLDPLIAVALR